jgi:transposase InsO family protein
MVSTDTFGSVDRLHRDGEDIAGAALGLDIARPRRIAFDLAAQAADLHVDRAIEDVVVVQPGAAEQLIARESALRRDYNEGRPHTSLGYLTPAEFAARYLACSPDSAIEERIG